MPFFRNFLGPLEIFTNLQKNFQKKFDPSPSLTPTLSPRFLARVMYGLTGQEKIVSMGLTLCIYLK
jgi:hypothetical protein